MTTKNDIIAGMQEIINDLFLDPVTITAATSARDVAEWDSVMHISIVAAAEMKFSVRFQMGDVEATNNVGEFADLILKRMSGK
ncbi:MAG: acyl carrier protein [Myxococcales bacterium]|jgi:acyl carrier protein|nr:acyl carrier protein [Myxococcales bacterium]HQY63666.1 acyl carrier protein [Polyangiaceae bacterium]